MSSSVNLLWSPASKGGKQAENYACGPEAKEITMKRKLIIAGIVSVGFVLVLGSISWAGEGRDDHRRGGERYHQRGWNPSPGNHCGWKRGRGNPPRHVHRHHPPCHHRCHHQRPVVVERHVHYHYQGRDRYSDGSYNIAASLIDHAFAISVAVSGIR